MTSHAEPEENTGKSTVRAWMFESQSRRLSVAWSSANDGSSLRTSDYFSLQLSRAIKCGNKIFFLKKKKIKKFYTSKK